jgi:protoporphyrin/coproporphyrin ferrochelatase
MNMGGPASEPEVGPFLGRLFGDREIIDLGRLQNILGPFISKRRTPKITQQYKQIDFSPIRRWTELQGEEMAKRLDKIRPESAPHKPYVMFRYADPLTEDTLMQMERDGVERAVAFSQYPQFSCTTAGSSLNHLWRELGRLGMSEEFKWSIIDRWYEHPKFIQAVAHRIHLGMKQFTADTAPDDVIIMFSAHSLPMRVVERGDAYPSEVAATVSRVMELVHRDYGYGSRHILCWQSKVGPLPWLTPSTGDSIKGLGRQGHKNVLVVPIAFTSDHIETLFEIDIEYAEDAEKAGIEQFKRAPSLNDEPLLFDAMAEIAATHLDSQLPASPQYALNCPQCVNPMCRTIVNPAAPYENMRSKAGFDTRSLDTK